jgi:hypothetical protein
VGKRRKENTSNSGSEPLRFTRHWLDGDLLSARVCDFQEMLIDEPDAFDPDEKFRDEDGIWDIGFDVRADLKRDAHCKIGLRVIVHDEARVYDVMQLGLQTLVHPSLFSFAAQIVFKTAEILIAHARTRGAEALIEAFFIEAERFGLNEGTSTAVIARIGRLQPVQRVLSHAVRTFIIGHEIGHYLVHSLKGPVDPDANDETELQCDSVGLDATFFFDERYSFPIVEDSEDGPEADVMEGLDIAWDVFEHLATALFFGDALCRWTCGCLDGKTLDVLPLATRRCEAVITKFRSSEVGRRVTPAWMPSSAVLNQAFLESAAFVERTVNLQDDRFAMVRLPTTRYDMASDSIRLRDSFLKRLRSLGLVGSWGGVLLPERQDSIGLERWSQVVERSTGKIPVRRSRPMLS